MTKPSSKQKSRRGAKASRSSFRATSKTKAKPAKAPKPSKSATKKAVATKQAAPKRSAAPKAAAIKAAATKATTVPKTRKLLGEITVPSGRLAIFDIGLMGYLPRPALEPAIVTASVPADRPLSVVGVPVGTGRFSDCWDHVAVVLGAGEVHASKKLGEAGVDFARLVCMDHAALDHWQHEDSLDGRADFVFWGRDQVQLAKVMNASRTKDGYGWINLPVAEAEAKADEVARRKASNKWLLATDYRPHSHHFHALAAARKSPLGAGALELADTKLLVFFTSWGDGVFPIYLDLDGDGHPVQIRVQLATLQSNAAMAAVNR